MRKKRIDNICVKIVSNSVRIKQLEQQNAKLLAIVKELIEIGDKKYYEICDFSSDVYGLAEKAEITLAKVKGE